MISYNDTISLIKALERVAPPATFLLDTFFPNVEPIVNSSKIAVEYVSEGRKLAPYVVGRAINLSRENSHIQIFTPPMIGARRVISLDDIEQRGFGETIYSTLTPAQRAGQLQAKDLLQLRASIINRKNKMAAEILTTGKHEIKSLADDGKMELASVVSYDGWKGLMIPQTNWSNATAKIYSDIKNASERIQQATGEIPTIMVIGKNVEEYLLKNTEIKNWLMIPNRENLGMMSLQPKYQYPSIRRIGYLSSLNMEIYSYMESYVDDDGQVKSFIGENDVIIGLAGKGRQIHGAVTLVDDRNISFSSYAAEYVPQYSGSKDSNTIELSVYSRCVLAPRMADEWICIKSCGE